MSQKKLVVVSSTIFTRCYAFESVQIQLALERGKLRLTEVGGHDLGHKHFRLVHHKAPSVGLPGG